VTRLGVRPPRADQVEQLVSYARVEPHRRLVEEQHARLRDERARQLEPPALAAAVAADRAVDQLREAERVDEVADAARGRARLDSPEAGVQVEMAPAGQGAVDHRLLEDDAADAPCRQRFPHDVEAADARRPAARRDRRRQHADRGRLARAVRPQQAEHLTVRDVEVDPADGLHSARVGLAKLSYLDHRTTSCHISVVLCVKEMTDLDERM